MVLESNDVEEIITCILRPKRPKVYKTRYDYIILSNNMGSMICGYDHLNLTVWTWLFGVDC